MFYLVPYGKSLLSSIAKFEDFALACRFADSAHHGNGDHYNVVEFKTVWTTKTLDQLTVGEGRTTDLRSPESVIVQTPVEQKTAVEASPIETAPVEVEPVEVEPVEASPEDPTPVDVEPVETAPVKVPRSETRTFRKCMSIFDGPMPAVLRSLSNTVALGKASSVLGIPEGVIKRLAKEGKINIYNNGQEGTFRRYFIPAADLRRLYKK